MRTRQQLDTIGVGVLTLQERIKFMRRYDNAKTIENAIRVKSSIFLKVYAYISFTNMELSKKNSRLSSVDMELISGNAIVELIKKLPKIFVTLEEGEFNKDIYNGFKVILHGLFTDKKRAFVSDMRVAKKSHVYELENIASYDDYYNSL